MKQQQLNAPVLHIKKETLNNGLTILVRETHMVPKVSVQLWYNVGSKDEQTCEKGIAHLIEHMIFKGTEKLSESDINMITHKLSGSCNAFTSYDYTGYLFNFPSHHWEAALPIMADCMQNCTFKEEFLKSEMKAVIQELKMYRDNYSTVLIEHMIANIFPDHPYHYPIIGFKQDLWNLKREHLVSFYKKHYVPNNATLVVVGDIDASIVFKKAEEYFGSIPSCPEYTKETFYHNRDIIGTSITLYRDIKQSMTMLAFTVPGAHSKRTLTFDVLSFLLGEGKSSRLYSKLVDTLEIVTELETFYYDLFEYGLFIIYFQPKNKEEIEHITTLILNELRILLEQGIPNEELQRARNQATADYLSMFESTEKQAYLIGQAYIATGDTQIISNYLKPSDEELKNDIFELLTTYFRPSLMHKGTILPLHEKDKKMWQEIQQLSDQEDNKILSQIVRTTQLEKGTEIEKYTAVQGKQFHFPQPERFELPNGLTILYYHNTNIPKVEILLDLETKHYYEPDHKEGLSMFLSGLLMEGTKQYSGSKFAEEVESYGMSISSSPGLIQMSVLHKDLEYGLFLLKELITQAELPEEAIEKITHQMLADLDNYWDTPSSFAEYLARKEIYKNHPYSKMVLGSHESIRAISQEDLRTFYRESFTPKGSVLVIVGNLDSYSIPFLIEKIFGNWSGPTPRVIDFPPVQKITSSSIVYPINRDQVVLCFAQSSVARSNSLYDPLLIFDQILTGGVMKSMNTRLFKLREETGLFYTIGGSLLFNSGKQPGMVFIKTIVSLDRLEEAKVVISDTLNTAAERISLEELQEAQNAIIYNLIDLFESNKAIASNFLFLERYKLSKNFFDTRAEKLYSYTCNDVQNAGRAILKNTPKIEIIIGRLENQ
jgi:zinc protease